MDNKAFEVRLSSWIGLIREANASGLPKKVWCDEHNISTRKFYYWQKKVRAYFLENADQLQQSRSSVKPEVSLPSIQEPMTEEEQPRFFEIPDSALACSDDINHTASAIITGESLTPSMMIRCGSFQVYLENNVCAKALSTVLKVIRDA